MTRSSRRSLRAAAVFAAGALALALAACGAKQTPSSQSTKATALSVGRESVYQVVPARLSTGPQISGSLEAEKEATVGAEVSGAVLATYAEVGQAVAPGTLLAIEGEPRAGVGEHRLGVHHVPARRLGVALGDGAALQ